MRHKGAKNTAARLSKQDHDAPHDSGTGQSRTRSDGSHTRSLRQSGAREGGIELVNCPSEVRTARPDDVSEVYRLLLMGHAENALFPVDNGRAAYFIQRFLWSHHMPEDDAGPRGIIGVIGPRGGHLEAMTMVGIGQQWYTSHKHLEEFIVFVDQNHRRSNHGRALIDWLKEQSHKTSLPLLTGILTNQRTIGKVRLYERYYGEKAGAFFVYKQDGWENDKAIITIPSSNDVSW